MDFLFFINSILLGVGLAMDAFSVSMANGLQEPHMRRSRMVEMAGIYGGFQFLMPVVGWFCVHTVADYFEAFQKFIPWIALLLLLYIGGKMLLEGIHSRKEEATEFSGSEIGIGTLMLQGVATSIDALSVGFTISAYNTEMAILCSLLIALTTFVICMVGIRIGKTFGTKLAGRASILGGVILILIGLEIFVKGLGIL